MRRSADRTKGMLKRLTGPMALSVLALAGPAASGVEYVEVVKLGAPDLQATDQFGENVVMSGDRLAVASRHWNVGTGSVYIFERNQGGSNAWGPTAKLIDPTPQAGELFGYDIALDGSTLSVVTAFGWEPGIRVFELTSRRTWELTAEMNDRVYAATAVSGDTMVGANASEDRVDVFERDAGGPDGWGLVAVLRPSIGGLTKFGDNVAIDGDVVVAGAWGDDELAEDAGSAYVWERDAGGIWQEQEVAKLFASDGAEDDVFGTSVAVEGDLVAVGAPRTTAPFGNSGAVYLFRRDEFGAWNEIAKLVADDAELGDGAGNAVAIEGGRVIVGVEGRDVGELRSVGAVFVFEEDEVGVWQHVTTLRAADEEDTDLFGNAVASSGSTVAVGAYLDGELGFNTGAAYVFQLVAAPAIELTGSCPGEVSFTVSGATPSGAVAVAGAASEGVTAVPGQACPGAEMGLEEPRLLRQFVVDSDGQAQFTRQVGPAFCGWFLQGLDAVTCGVGETRQVP